MKYVGEFKNGLRHGQGTETLPNGEKYVGEFQDDERLTNQILSYVFKDNLYEGPDILTKEDPSAFQNIVFVKEKKIKWWDKRKETTSGWDESNFKV